MKSIKKNMTKKHVQKKPKQGFLATAVREFYSDLSDVKQNDPNLVHAVKLAKRCHEKYVNGDFDVQEPSKKNSVRVEEEESARLLKLERLCLNGLLM